MLPVGFFSELFFGIMNQNNDYKNQGYHRREPTSEDYIRSGEIEQDNYDDGKRNSIDEHGGLSNNYEKEDSEWYLKKRQLSH